MMLYDWSVMLKYTDKDPNKIMGYMKYLLITSEAYKEIRKTRYPYIRKIEAMDKKCAFILNEKGLLENKANATVLEICAYIGIASKRSFMEYENIGATHVPAYYFNGKALLQMQQNRLIEVRNDKIILKYE